MQLHKMDRTTYLIQNPFYLQGVPVSFGLDELTEPREIRILKIVVNLKGDLVLECKQTFADFFAFLDKL